MGLFFDATIVPVLFFFFYFWPIKFKNIGEKAYNDITDSLPT